MTDTKVDGKAKLKQVEAELVAARKTEIAKLLGLHPLIAEDIALSTESVLEYRAKAELRSVLEEGADRSDGLDALMLRMGAGATLAGPDPRATGGQFYLVLNGGLEHEGVAYGRWSMIYVDRRDEAFQVKAGAQGLEALVLNFPRLAA